MVRMGQKLAMTESNMKGKTENWMISVKNLNLNMKTFKKGLPLEVKN